MMDKMILDRIYSVAKKLSSDSKTQVGAGVIINNELIIGVNHLANTLPEYEITNRTKLFYDTMIHAEIDLCMKIGGSLAGSTVYVTLFPCDNCAKRLISMGVKHIIVKEDRPNASYIIKAKELLLAANITWELV